jgi:biopolymer transport protein ExbD
MSGAVSDNRADPNLTPLLDVVLQLIMFFMITVNFVRVEHFNKDVVLPPAQMGVPLDKGAEDWIFLNLSKEGKLVGTAEDLNSPEKLRVHLLREKEGLERVARLKGRTTELKVVVVLRAHQDAFYEDVWQVLDSCTKAGFRHWQLRVMTKAGRKTA